jgi:hypothetical protein
VHTPTLPARLQAWQVPVHALSQQTPCWHAPEPHSALPVHAAPLSFFLQTPPMHE